jgi:hypothetical protein
MNKALWTLILVALLLWASAAFASPRDELVAILKDKAPVAEGLCSVKGNTMHKDGTPMKCFAFASPQDDKHLWLVVVDIEGALYVFKGNLENGETELVWWRGKRDT